jgi:hypothetical protein
MVAEDASDRKRGDDATAAALPTGKERAVRVMPNYVRGRGSDDSNSMRVVRPSSSGASS